MSETTANHLSHHTDAQREPISDSEYHCIAGDQLALLCVPCKYHGSEEPSSGSGAVRVCVSRDADVSALRAAVAAQLEPKTSGFGPWRQTLSAEPGQIHFFVSGGSDGTELVPVTQGVAQIAQQSPHCPHTENSTGGVPTSPVLYYTIEGRYGDDDLLLCCALCACIAACCACCCAANQAGNQGNSNNQSNYNNNKPNPPPVQQTNQYNYYNDQPNQSGYGQNPYNGNVQGTGYGAPPTQNYYSQGYNNQGYNNQGYNSQGYNNQGYNNQGYNNQGYNSQGYNNQGYNSQGYNQAGYNQGGYSQNQTGHAL